MRHSTFIYNGSERYWYFPSDEGPLEARQNHRAPPGERALSHAASNAAQWRPACCREGTAKRIESGKEVYQISTFSGEKGDYGALNIIT
jgi:hypothetical protein